MTYKPPRSVHVFFQFAFHDACVLGPGPRFEACAYMPDKFRCLCKISRSYQMQKEWTIMRRESKKDFWACKVLFVVV